MKNHSTEPNYLAITQANYKKIFYVNNVKEYLEILIQVGIELFGVPGATFVPYDEWKQTLPPLVYGEVPEVTRFSWNTILTSPETRQVCKNCKILHGETDCILIASKQSLLNRVQCYPLVCSDRETGVINYFFPSTTSLDPIAINYFTEFLEAIGQVISNHLSREKELSTFRQIHSRHSVKSDLPESLIRFIENIQIGLESDFILIYFPMGLPAEYGNNKKFISSIVAGDNSLCILEEAFLEKLSENMRGTGEAKTVENVYSRQLGRNEKLLVFSLGKREDQSFGIVIFGTDMQLNCSMNYLTLLKTITDQISIMMQIKSLTVYAELQAIFEERNRLSREIHDGMAQTIAFLKMQTSQMQKFLQYGELEKLSTILKTNFRTLSDAYIDARQSIEDLRLNPGTNFAQWIMQVTSDFEQSTLIKVIIDQSIYSVEFPVSVQSQLIRIIQESLNNIRKHSGATAVKFFVERVSDCPQLNIHDNGCGFDYGEAVNNQKFHYGLLGMRERADHIGADFQIRSEKGSGTCITIRVANDVVEGLCPK